MRRSRSCFGRWICGLALCAGGLQAQHPAFAGLDAETTKVLNLFEEIARVPRCSGQEAAIGSWLKAWGLANGLKVEAGRGGNVFIRVPASTGYEAAPGIILQTHMDMVCQKDAASPHDFSKDPITLVRDGDWLRADRTTLGADDGIGMALALSLAQDRGLPHPPLQLIFTAGEETTGEGVDALERKNIDGKVLINLDSEQEGMLVIGDASATGSAITLFLKSEPLSAEAGVYTLRVQGLRGGHSGVDILKRRANAIKVMARTLDGLQKAGDLRLITVKGGTARNAIPRMVEAQVTLRAESLEQAQKVVQGVQEAVLGECGSEDPGLRIVLQPSGDPRPQSAFTKDETARVVSLLLALPNGAAAMDERFPGVPESSNSLGIIESTSASVTVQSMQRGSVLPKLLALNQKIADAAAGAKATVRSGSPGAPWLTSPDADVVRRCKAAYTRVFGQAPIVSIVHGGLECGDISRKGGGLDTVSIGPTIENPHSPGERVSIPSIKRVRDLLVAVLADYR